ncbi:hypothetical protein [Coprococcus eutactus]|uniref:hypothetical protein n=1 Tax=Coprococcus eutactus TaxID=33043 RepID=UPI003219C9F5
MNKYGQMDIFDFLPNPVYNPIFDFLSSYGTGFVGGRERIAKYWNEPHNKKERANFLKSEYGVGGFSAWGFMQKEPNKVYSGSTLGGKISIGYTDQDLNRVDMIITFEQLADSVSEMISAGIFPHVK